MLQSRWTAGRWRNVHTSRLQFAAGAENKARISEYDLYESYSLINENNDSETSNE